MPDEPLQRYELVTLLGRGATTEVHLAHDHVLDRPVAVKVFAAHLDPAARHRFDHEARALARLSHGGLVSIFDVGTIADRPYLVMQLVDGESLSCRLLSGPLPAATVVRMGALLADALAHAHDRGVVHRDVKPSNILMGDEDQPFLTDFGIALLTGASRLTSTNEIIGTPAYLAPEQILGDEVGPPADVYALGLVLLECLTGELEYAGGTRLESALARLHRPPNIPGSLPPGIAGLLGAMTARQAADRPTAADCARRFARTSDEPVPVVAARPFSRRRRTLAAAAVTVAVGAGVAFALNAFQPSAPGPAPEQGVADHHPLAQPAAPTTTRTTPPTTPALTPPVTGPVTLDQQLATGAAIPPSPSAASPATTTTKAAKKSKTHGKSGGGNGNG